MRSVAVDFQAGRLVEQEIDQPPSPDTGEVLFRVHSVGVCGTDRELAAARLGEPPRGQNTLVIGHEALGQVMECGAGVRGFERGDWVVPTVRRSCPERCPACSSGHRDLCTTLRYSERGIFRAHGYFTEYAKDSAGDLVRVPTALGDDAVLLEPLSICEKAVARGIALLQTHERRALILGLGPIGILCALVLDLRGFHVTVHSAEPADHPRAALLSRHAIRYSPALPVASADLIIEAAGSGDLVLSALRLLAPGGCMVVLGAREVAGTVPFIDLLVKNQTIAGVVNSSRADFLAAAADLQRIPAATRSALIQRNRFKDFWTTLSGAPGLAPKQIHLIAG